VRARNQWTIEKKQSSPFREETFQLAQVTARREADWVHVEALQKLLRCKYARDAERLDLYYDCDEFEAVRDSFTLRTNETMLANSTSKSQFNIDRSMRESVKVAKTGE
jgi:hypothetical protein